MSDSAQQGCLLIADISGYTAYLTGSELEHAQGIIDELIGSILSATEPYFEVANLEGDAVFAYAPEGTLPPGPTALDVIDGTYAAFIGTREHIERNTNCPCEACSRISSLDLKFVAHHGSYIRSRLGDRQELTGPDVVLVHRLLKNSIPESTEIPAYAFVTDACLEALEATAAARSAVAHEEAYEHFEPISGRVFNLHDAYEANRGLNEVHVDAGTAWFDVECRTTLPLPQIWDHVTNPKWRQGWLESDSMTEDPVDGRRGVGTVQHCHHGSTHVTHTILDWDPGRRMTAESTIPMGGRFRYEVELAEVGDGRTRVGCRFSRVQGSNPLHTAALRVLTRVVGLQKNLVRGGDLLQQQLDDAAAELAGVGADAG